MSKSFLGSMDSVSSVLLDKTEANQTVELSAPGLKVAMKRVSANASEGQIFTVIDKSCVFNSKTV